MEEKQLSIQQIAWIRTQKEVNSIPQTTRTYIVAQLCSSLEKNGFELPPRDPLFLYLHLKKLKKSFDFECSKVAFADIIYIFGMHLVDVIVQRINRDKVEKRVNRIKNNVIIVSDLLETSPYCFPKIYSNLLASHWNVKAVNFLLQSLHRC